MSVNDQDWYAVNFENDQNQQNQNDLEELTAKTRRDAIEASDDEKAKANIPPPVKQRKHGNLTAADKAAHRKRLEWEQSEQGRQEMERQKKLEDEESQGKPNGMLDKPLVWILAACLILILFFEAPTI